MALNQKTNTRLRLIIIVVLVALGGTIYLVTSHALTPYSNPYTCAAQPLLTPGISTGTCVKYVQYTLHVLDSGTFNPTTKTAVQQFQFSNQVPQSGCGAVYTSCDGIVGPATWPKINAYNTAQTLAWLPTNMSLPTGAVSYTKCSNKLIGTESDADRPLDGARVFITAGGVTYAVTATTSTWSWTIPAALQTATNYSLVVTGQNVNSTATANGANPPLTGSPIAYSFSACLPPPVIQPPVAPAPPDPGITNQADPTFAPSTFDSLAGTGSLPAASSVSPVTASDASRSDTSNTDSPGPNGSMPNTSSGPVIDNKKAVAKPIKKSSSSPVKAILAGSFGFIILLAIVVGGRLLLLRRRVAPQHSYDVEGYNHVLPTEPEAISPQPPVASVPSVVPGVTIPQPATRLQPVAVPQPMYAPPVSSSPIARIINEVFYPNQPVTKPALTKQEALDVPDMYQIANAHPESFGNAQYVRSDPVVPPNKTP